ARARSRRTARSAVSTGCQGRQRDDPTRHRLVGGPDQSPAPSAASARGAVGGVAGEKMRWEIGNSELPIPYSLFSFSLHLRLRVVPVGYHGAVKVALVDRDRIDQAGGDVLQSVVHLDEAADLLALREAHRGSG